MKIKVFVTAEKEFSIDVKEYFGLRDDDWKDLTYRQKLSLIKGYIDNQYKIEFRYEEED